MRDVLEFGLLISEPLITTGGKIGRKPRKIVTIGAIVVPISLVPLRLEPE